MLSAMPPGADIRRTGQGVGQTTPAGPRRSVRRVTLRTSKLGAMSKNCSHRTWEIPMHDTTKRPSALVYVGFAAVLLMLYLSEADLNSMLLRRAAGLRQHL